WSNTASRSDSMGMRLCPPASTFASSPSWASSATASSVLPGAWYSKADGFTPRQDSRSASFSSADTFWRIDMVELDGKVAVITGAGSGMARASTRTFVREGARVLAADISGREEEAAKELGDAVVPFRCDVTKEDQVEAMFATALGTFGRVDAVLNVVGIGAASPLAEVTTDDYDRVMDVDLRGVFLGTKHGINAMLPNCGGVIVNWTSTG